MVTPRRKKADSDPPQAESETASVTPDLPATTANPTSPSESSSDTNGNGGDARKPAKVFGYLVARDTFVQASIWERVVTLADGSTFTTHDVSVRKRYRDAQDGEWKSLSSFRGSEIYAVLHALTQASAWILEARAAASTCPF